MLNMGHNKQWHMVVCCSGLWSAADSSQAETKPNLMMTLNVPKERKTNEGY